MSFAPCREALQQVDVKKAEILRELPPAARYLAEHIDSAAPMCNIFRGVFSSRFSLSSAAIERGVPRECVVAARLEGEIDKRLAALIESGSRLALLSAEVDECDASALPVAVQWQIALAPPGRDVAAAAARLPFDPRRHVARRFVADNKEVWKAAEPSQREPLMADPLIYYESRFANQFAATEAFGFDGATLMEHVARPLGEGRFWVPSTYRYARLLSRVHACIVLSNAAAHPNALYAACMTPADYQLPATSDGYEIDGDSLSAAVEFIERRLVPALIVFDPRHLVLTVTPFGVPRWIEVYHAHVAGRQAKDAAVKLPPRNGATSARATDSLECSIRIVAYFVELRHLDPLAAVADHRGPRPLEMAAAPVEAAKEQGATSSASRDDK